MVSFRCPTFPDDYLANLVSPLGDRQRWPYFIGLTTIFAAGIYFRFRALGVAPLWIDEAHTAWAARNFLAGEGFSDPVGASSPYYRGRFTTSLPIAASFWLLGQSEFAARLPMALYGVATLTIAVQFGRRYGRIHAMLVGSFVAFDPLVLIWARDARMYSPLAFYVIASLYLFVVWRGDHDLSLSTPHPYALGVLTLLGQHTHRAYLALGPAVLLVLLTDVGRGMEWRLSLQSLDGIGRRAVILAGGATVAATGYLVFSGPPTVLTALTPGTWPDRGPWYYWRLFGQAYPLLRWVMVAGTVWLWAHRPEARVVVAALVVSFLIASVTPRKAPRYVSHIALLVGVVGLVTVGDGLAFLWRTVADDLGEDKTLPPTSRAITYFVPIVIVLLIASPTAALAAVDATHDPPYHPERSSWDDASAWLDDNADEGDVIVSTRPELSMWYFGRTDYFFRQNGIESPEFRDGVYVHTRTGTVYLNETSDVRRLIDCHDDIYLIAGKKFQTGFTDPKPRELVESKFERRARFPGVTVYYHSG